MNKCFRIAVLMSASVMALAACSKESVTPSTSDGGVRKIITFNAGPVDTKTVFGDKAGNKYPTLWTANQQVAISYNLGEFQNVDVTNISEDQTTASFTATVEPDLTEGATHTFYAVSPADASKYINEKPYVSIQMLQQPLQNSCDEMSQLLVAKSQSFTTIPNYVSLDFNHVVAYGKMTLKFPEEIVGIDHIQIDSSEEIAGWFVYNSDTHLLEKSTDGRYKGYNYFLLRPQSSEGIYFSIAPIGDMQGKSLTVTVNTTDKKTYTKIIAPTEPGKLAFNAGQVSEFTVNFTK